MSEYLEKLTEACKKREKNKPHRNNETFMLIDHANKWEWELTVLEITDKGFIIYRACCPGEEVYDGHDLYTIKLLEKELKDFYMDEYDSVKCVRLESDRTYTYPLKSLITLLKKISKEVN